MRYLFHLATGGMTHMLWMTGSSIEVARATGRIVVPLTERNRAFRLPFHDIFESTDPYLADRRQAAIALDEYDGPASGLLDDPAGIPLTMNDQGCYSIPNRPDLPPTFLGLDPVKAGSNAPFLITAGQVLETGTVLPPTRSRVLQGLRSVLAATRLESETVAQATRWRMRLPSGYVGVHYRNTDRKHSLDDVLTATRHALQEFELSDVYWATDDPASVARARRALPDVTVHNYGSSIDVNAEGAQNLHYLDDKALAKYGTSKGAELRAVLADTYVLTSATDFVRSDDSSLSWFVALLRSNPELAGGWFAKGRLACEMESFTVRVHSSLAGPSTNEDGRSTISLPQPIDLQRVLLDAWQHSALERTRGDAALAAVEAEAEAASALSRDESVETRAVAAEALARRRGQELKRLRRKRNILASYLAGISRTLPGRLAFRWSRFRGGGAVWVRGLDSLAGTARSIVTLRRPRGLRPSPLFDVEWYRGAYTGVPSETLGAWRYYQRHGVAEHHRPNEWFDVTWYQETYPDVPREPLAAIEHYLHSGAWEGRDPGPEFSSLWYLRENPGVVASGMNPLVHYLDVGRFDGRTRGPDRIVKEG